MEDIFSKQVPLLFKASDKEERKVFVQLQMRLQSNKHDSKRELLVKLTDDQDLYFLYSLRLAEEDFQSLKMQQGLLVDFVSFPQKLVDLLEMCIKENHKENPKFVIHFISGGSSLLGGDAPCVMNIVETNPFRHLNHLSLKFLPGSDADIKSHLASCIKQLKESYSLIQHKFEHTSRDLSEKLETTQELLGSKSKELELLKLEWSSRITDVTSKHKEEMALEKEKTLQFQTNLQIQFDKERRELEQGNSKHVRQMESRLEELEALNKDLTDKKYKSESAIREYKSRLSSLEEEYGRMKTELLSLRKDNTSLDSARLEKDKYNNQLQTRVAVLEQELKDKAELLERLNDLLTSEKDKKKHLENELESRLKENTKLESKVKAMGDELKKGNEIIKKLQGEIKAYHAKVKLRTQIATEQEKLLGEKDSELEKLRQELATTKDKLRITEDKNQKLSSDMDEAKQKLIESKQSLETSDTMIKWLNKQLNEQRINQNILGHFELPASTHSRPPMAIHNYSTSSHGSAMTQDSLRQVQRPVTSAPPTIRQPQVEYQAGQVNVKSQIPVSSVARKNQTNGSPTQKENLISAEMDNKEKNPPLDPKFLMKRDEAIPVRGILNQNGTSRSPVGMASIPFSSSAVIQSQNSAPTAPAPGQPTPSSGAPYMNGGRHADGGALRLSQQLIVPKSQPPLASAYFPAQS